MPVAPLKVTDTELAPVNSSVAPVAIVAAAFLGNNRKYLTDRVAAKIRN